MSVHSIGYVLICHAPQDRAYAADLARQLRSAGIQTHWDEDGAPADTLARRVRKGAALLVVMTAAAEEYELVTEQVKQAQREQTPVYALSVDGEKLFELDEARSWPSARGQRLDDDLLRELSRDVELKTADDLKMGRGALVAAVAGCVAVAVLVTVLVLDNGSGSKAGDPVVADNPSPTTAVSSAAPLPTGDLAAGQVRIDSPTEATLVRRCQKLSGTARLATDHTLVYAVNRINPQSNDWYYGYVGAYQNGFVPASWNGTVYFGTTTKQKYDLFLYVMRVDAAKTFWDKHKSKDGSYAFGESSPPGKAAAHVRVTQGSTDEC
jgi:hypothetical protein